MKRDTKRIRKTIAKLEKDLLKDTSPGNFMHLSEEYRKLDESTSAITTLRRGLTVHPESASLKLALAKLLLDSRNLVEVRTLAESVLQKNPDNLVARKLLNEIPMGDADDAPVLEALEQGISTLESIAAPTENAQTHLPDEALAENSDLLEKAVELLRGQKFEEAVGLFKDYLEQNPDNEIAKNGFTMAYAAWIEQEGISEESQDDLEISSSAQHKNEIDKLRFTQDYLQLWLDAIREVRKNRSAGVDV